MNHVSPYHDVHLPIVRGYLCGSPPVPINIMLDTGLSFNWIATNKVGKSLLNFQIPFDKIFEVVQKNVTVDVSDLEGNTKRKTKVVNFELALLEGFKIEAYNIDHIHTFSELKLPDHVTSNYQMDRPTLERGERLISC